jgi:transposase-like protein
MAGSGIQQPRTRAQRQALVAAYAASGLSQRAFCAQHGIGVSTLRYWQKRLADAEATADGAPAPSTRLVPVQVLEESIVGTGVTLVGAGGVRIEVAASFDGATLRRVLATLGTAA